MLAACPCLAPVVVRLLAVPPFLASCVTYVGRIGAVSPGYFDDHPYWPTERVFVSEMGCDPLLQSLSIAELLGLVHVGTPEGARRDADGAKPGPPLEADSRRAQHCIYIMRLRCDAGSGL